MWAVRVFGKDCHDLEECPLPNPPPQGREQVAADSGVAGRLKKNARNINGRNFQVAFIARQMEQTPRAFFQTAFEPIGRMCAARHTHSGLGLQGKWGTRTYRTRPTYELQIAIFPAEPLIPTATPSSLPWEKVRERATSRKACIRAVKVLERLLQFGECPLPNPPPRGREQVAADFAVSGSLKMGYAAGRLGLQTQCF